MRILIASFLILFGFLASAEFSGPQIQLAIQATAIVADGVTDNSAILAGYLAGMPAAGGILVLPAGNIVLNMPAIGTGLTMPANVCVVGQGSGATTLFPTNGTTTGTVTVFAVNGANDCFRDFAVNNQMTNTNTSHANILFNINSSNSSFNNLYIEGNASIANPYIFDVFYFGNSFTKMNVDHNTIRDVRYGLLTPGTNSQTYTDLHFTNNWFYGNTADDLSFNSPTGVIQGVVVEGNRFENNIAGSNFGDFGIMLGSASVYDYRIIGNEFVGTVQTDAIHLEQDEENVTITGNTFNLAGGTANAITALANNYLSSSSYGIVGLTISSNVIKTSTTSTGRGINIANTAQAASSAVQDAIVGNSISGFSYGVFVQSTRQEIIDSNILYNNGVGLGGTKPTMNMSRNTINSNTTGVQFQYGGVLGMNSYLSNTTMIGIPSANSSNAGRIAENGLTYSATGISIPAGTSTVALFSSAGSGSTNIKINGNVNIQMLSGNYQANAFYNLNYDGTTFTPVTISTTSSGGVTLGALSASGTPSVIYVSVTNSTGNTITADMDVVVTGGFQY